MRKRARVIPKNVLAQEVLRRKYVEEPWPQRLILVKSNLDKDSAVRARGSVTKLFYNLSYPYLYIDERDLGGLGDMVMGATVEKEAADAKAVPGDKGNISALDSITDAGRARTTGTRKRRRPKKSGGSKKDGPSDTGKDGKVSTRDNQ